MSRTSKLGSALYAAEVTFGEDVATFGTRVPILDLVDASGLVQEKLEGMRTVQLRNQKTLPFAGPKGGSFKVRLWLTGHGSSTAGATAMTALGTLLGIVCGNGAVVAAAGTTVASATDADTFVTVASGTFTPGGVCFVGVKGDARGAGQAFAIASHTGTAMQGLTALGATPASPDIVAPAENIYPTEAHTAAVTGTRWRLMTANQQYECFGCYPTAWDFETELGKGASVTITFGVSRWREVSETFPVATSVNEFTPGATAGGSFCLQAHGTAARTEIAIRSFKLSAKLGMVPILGQGGITADQLNVGAVREPDEYMFEFTEDAQAASAAPTRPAQWDTDTYYHALLSGNGAASGKRWAMYFRKACFAGQRPVQFNDGGVNRYRSQLYATADEGGTDDITRSAFLIALG